MEVLDKIEVSPEQFEEVKEQLAELTEMDECLHFRAIACYQIFRVPVDDKTTLSYWVRVIENEGGFEIEILKEELFD